MSGDYAILFVLLQEPRAKNKNYLGKTGGTIHKHINNLFNCVRFQKKNVPQYSGVATFFQYLYKEVKNKFCMVGFVIFLVNLIA